jgi:hypothetical protein
MDCLKRGFYAARLAEQLNVCTTIGVIGQNDLPGISSLRNMMRNVHHYDPGKAGRDKKLSEIIIFAGRQFPIDYMSHHFGNTWTGVSVD